MDNQAIKEVLNELFSHLERLETQSEAILQFLKEKKRVTDKQLAPYLEQAGNASSVKWRAARVRIDHLLEPEKPEKEVKLGKKPELHEAPATVLSKDKSSKPENQEAQDSEPKNQNGKRTELGDLLSGNGDQRDEDKSEAENVKAHPAGVQAEKPEAKSESTSASKEIDAQAKGSDKSDTKDLHHPTEATKPLARQEDTESAAQLSSEEKKGGQEAA